MIGIWVIFFIFALYLVSVPIDPALRDFWWLSIIGFTLSIFSGLKLREVFGNDLHTKSKQKIFNAISSLTDFSWKMHTGDEFSKEEKKAARDFLLYEYDQNFFSETEVPNQPEPLRYMMRTDGKETFKESGLYTNYTAVKCQDKLTSTWNNLEIETHKTLVEIYIGQSSMTVFRGFIIKARIDKEFQGETYVQTESDSGSVAGESWFDFHGDDSVREAELEWIDFERFLKVKSSDPTETRQIFTPDYMEVLYDWWQEHDEPLRMAFKNQAVYITYPTGINLEPKTFRDSKKEKAAVMEVLDFLLFVENIVKMIIGGQRILFDKPLRSKK